ncbi:NeuD/PglB/VioB family sugar acetyltransferase [Gammaproteobacteria bacterium]|nr:NeuD/PglB/VioB family sugar acetyltransferase [Gammaproteobacteria bacterium]
MPDNPSLVLIGSGGHARSCIDVIELQRKYCLYGLIGKSSEVGDEVHGYSVIGSDLDLREVGLSVEYALVAVGHIKNVELRLKLIDQVKAAGFKLATIVSPLAYVSPTASLGRGTIIMHHALINSSASIGENCIINSKTLVEHDVTVGDCCHISTGAVLNGGVTIGDRTFVGSSAVIMEGIVVPTDSIVGMGEKVKRQLPRDESA